MLDNTRFYGDNVRFGIGVVEDIDDPLKAGRARVRVYGIHSPFQEELPITDLPWSQVMMPNTSASISGEGDTPQLTRGSQVFGFFLDSNTYQQFLIVGTMVGFSGRTVVQRDLDPPKVDDNGIEEPARLVGDSNAEKAFHFFIQYGGYTEDQAAGIVGNLQNESVGLNPDKDGGLIGWSGDRLKALEEIAANSELQFSDLGIQLSFILAELQGPFVSASKKLVNTQHPQDAAEVFAKDYLGKSASSTTKTYANNAKAAFGSTGGSDTGPFQESSIDRSEYAEGAIVESSEELLNILKSAKKKRQITELIVHDTGTYIDQQVTVADLSRKHIAQGFSGIQFHFLIRRDGTLQVGRDVGLKESLISNTVVDENVTTISSAGLQFIKDREGFVANATADGSGFAIGYGHNNLPSGVPVTQEDDGPITRATADEYLETDTTYLAENIITALNGVPINQNQLDAYISLAYNIGLSAFTGSYTLKLFKQGKKEEAADAILLWKFATIDGVRDEYLLSRRQLERNLFLKPTTTDQRVSIARSDTSLSIALAGGKKGTTANQSLKTEENFTDRQWETFDWFVEHFISIWRDSNILGHRDVDNISTDPQFNVSAYIESKFDHENKQDAPNNPIVPNDQTSIPSPTLDTSIIEDQVTSTTPINLVEATPDEDVTVNEASGTSTVTNPGFNINLTPYLLTASFATILAQQSIRKLIDVYDVAPTNGDVLTWVAANSRYEPQAQTGGGSLSNIVEDTTPQLGGNLDVNGNKIVSTSSGNIDIEPDGTGNVLLGNFTFDADQSVGAGQDNYVLKYDHSAGTISLEAETAGSGLYSVSDTIATIAGGDFLSFIDINDSNNPKRTTVTNFISDNSLLASGDNISTLTNDSGYTTNAGTVTSVAVSATDGIEVDSGSPITSSGTIAISLTAASITSLASADSALQNVVEDTTPQLGGDLDGQGNDLNNLGVVFMTEQANAEVDVAGKGQWWVKTATPNLPMFTNDAGTDFQLATLTGTETFTNKSGNISQWTNDSGYTTNAGTVTSVAVSATNGVEVDSGSPITSSGTIAISLTAASITSLGLADTALQSLVGDTTPQLGGSLDVNGNKIVSTSNGNIDIEPHGSGNVLLGNLTFDADQTVGAGQDDYILTYDHASGTIGLEAAGAGGNVSNTGTPVDNQLAVWTNATTVEGDAGLTWTGSAFTITHASVSPSFNMTASDNDVININLDANRTTSGAPIGDIAFLWNGTEVANIIGYAGDDSTNKDDGYILFSTAEGGILTEQMRIEQDGVIHVNKEFFFTEQADHTAAPTAARGILWVKNDTPNSLIFTDDAGTDYDLTSYTANTGTVDTSGTPANDQLAIFTDADTIEGSSNVTYDGTTFNITQGIKFTERADHAATPATTFGELWVKNDTPNALMFTDDAGTDYDLTAAVGGGNVSNTGTPVNNQLAIWTDATTVEGVAAVTYDGTTFNLTQGIKFTERADHAATPAASFGELWVRSDTPNKIIFTDDAGTDHDLSAGLADIVEDTTPQLGGDLDTNSNNILIDDSHGILDASGNIQLIFATMASAVNYIQIENASTGTAPVITSGGTDTNVDLNLKTAGTGNVTVDGNRVLTVADEGTGNGLDADTLDGIEGSNYARTDIAETFTDDLYVNSGFLLVGHSTPTTYGASSYSLDIERTVLAAMRLINTGNDSPVFDFGGNRSSANQIVGIFRFQWNGTNVGAIDCRSGTDTTNKDDGYIRFRVGQGGSLTQAMYIEQDAGVVIGSPTGSSNGAGTLNAEAVYDDNSLLSCYVFDQVIDNDINLRKWDNRVVDRVRKEEIPIKSDEDRKGRKVIKDGDEEYYIKTSIEKRKHEFARKFKNRIGTEYDPLTLDGYAKHWKEKRHLTSMPNEDKYDIEKGMASGSWVQRLVETVEIQAVLIEQLNQKLKALEKK